MNEFNCFGYMGTYIYRDYLCVYEHARDAYISFYSRRNSCRLLCISIIGTYRYLG